MWVLCISQDGEGKDRRSNCKGNSGRVEGVLRVVAWLWLQRRRGRGAIVGKIAHRGRGLARRVMVWQYFDLVAKIG